MKALAAGGAVDEAREQVHGIRSRRLLVGAWSEIAKAEVQRDREAAAQEALGHGREAIDRIAEARERDDGLLDLAEAQARTGDFAAALATAGRVQDPGVRALSHAAVAEVLGQVDRR